MQLPENVQQRLAAEFHFAADMMKETANPLRKLYFFSAIYGEASRALNWSWDRDLALIHNVCQHTYQQIQGGVSAMVSGAERAIDLPSSLLDELTQTTHDLATYVAKGADTDAEALCALMGRFCELGYAITGNGFYLFTRGTLKL